MVTPHWPVACLESKRLCFVHRVREVCWDLVARQDPLELLYASPFSFPLMEPGRCLFDISGLLFSGCCWRWWPSRSQRKHGMNTAFSDPISSYFCSCFLSSLESLQTQSVCLHVNLLYSKVKGHTLAIADDNDNKLLCYRLWTKYSFMITIFPFF